jgi:cytoskeleton protein RodZ
MHRPGHVDASGGPAASDEGVEAPGQPEAREAGRPVVVRRNAGLAALVGAAASAIAIAYLWRATQTAAPLDWALCAVMAAIAAVYLAALVDARTPLLVADDLGVRIRLGNQWRGLPWDAVGTVVVRPRRGLLADGRLVFAPHSEARALDGLDARARRAATLNQKVYGAPLAVPLGLTTRTSAQGQDLLDGLSDLAAGRAEVVVVQPEVPREAVAEDVAEDPFAEDPKDAQNPLDAWADGAASTPATTDEVEEVVGLTTGEAGEAGENGLGDSGAPEGTGTGTGTGTHTHTDPDTGADTDTDTGTDAGDPDQRPERRSLAGRLGTLVSRAGRGRSHDVDSQADPGPGPGPDGEHDLVGDHDAVEADGDPAAPAEPATRATSPLRSRRWAARADVARESPPAVLGNAALLPDHDREGRTELPEGRELRRGDVELIGPHGFGDDRVRPIASLGDPVEPLVIDDFAVEPADDPVIGPELAAARTRIGLSVDDLAERTRIRPHVIESIEVDDFAPCGGDFYARGHLRTLARVLGRDPAPLLAQFDHRYATAPINARRVFEAELATGMTGSMRSTVGGGPNWALLVGVVLALVMTWGVVRLFASEPPQHLQPPVPVLNGSAGVESRAGAGSAPVATPRPVRITLLGAQDGSEVVVRDRSGTVVWAGEIVLGEKRTVRAVPPVKVRAVDAGAIEVAVNGRDKGPLGELGQPGRQTFLRPQPR